jgi:hypothetical protein
MANQAYRADVVQLRIVWLAGLLLL